MYYSLKMDYFPVNYDKYTIHNIFLYTGPLSIAPTRTAMRKLPQRRLHYFKRGSSEISSIMIAVTTI